MYMRYVGGGIGHYQVPIPEEPPVPIPDDEEDTHSTPITTPSSSRIPSRAPSSAGSNSSLDPDSGTDSQDSDADGDGDAAPGDDDDDDLGPEDGDGFMDDEVEEGYAAL